MLSEVKRKHSKSTMSIVNSAMNQNIRHAQAKAEIMMSRMDPYNNAMAKEIHQDWYFTGVPEVRTTPLAIQYPDAKLPAPDAKDGALKHSAPTVERNEETLSALQKHLPYYLTSSGSVHSASLEVNDELVCCVPGQKSTSRQDDSRPQTSAAMPTDPLTVCIESPTREHSVSSGANRVSSETTVMDYYRHQVEPCWQPLTTAALLEHSKVTAIPIRGMGHQAHGHYSMWKPNNIQTTDSSTL